MEYNVGDKVIILVGLEKKEVVATVVDKDKVVGQWYYKLMYVENDKIFLTWKFSDKIKPLEDKSFEPKIRWYKGGKFMNESEENLNFKVGDRVVINRNIKGIANIPKGTKGIIKIVDYNNNQLGIEWDIDVYGKNGDDYFKRLDGHFWYVFSENVDLIEQIEPKVDIIVII